MKLMIPVLIFLLLLSMALPVSALEITAPRVPESGADNMPQQTQSFGKGLLELLRKVLLGLHPDLKQALTTSVSVIAAVMTVCEPFPMTSGKPRSWQVPWQWQPCCFPPPIP